MLDIKFIRENAQKFDAMMASRGNEIKASAILALDEEKRKKMTLIQELQAKRNHIAQQVPQVKKSGGNVDALLEESKKVNLDLKNLEADLSAEEKLNDILLTIPNLPDVSVPHGASEDDNT
jgi:seryl-tRNA synthetase